MSQTLKFGNKTWATKVGSTLAYNDENGNYKPLPFAFTRSTSATRVNKEGLIEVVTNDRPRIDYTDTSDGVLLLENSATNYSPHSEIPSIWTYTEFGSGSAGTITTGKTDMFGGTNAVQIDFPANADNVAIRFGTASSGLSSGDCTISIYVKLVESGNKNLQLRAGFEGIVNVNSTEFTRVDLSGTKNNTEAFNLKLRPSEGTSTGGFSIIVCHPQEENNSYLSSYIPTQGSAVTRVAETANNSGNSEVFNDSEGSLFLNINTPDTSAVPVISLSNGSLSNEIEFAYYGTNQFNFILRVSGGAPNVIGNIVGGSFSKFCVTYTTTDFKVYLNGFLIGSNTLPSPLSGLNVLDFNLPNGVNNFYGKTKEIAYYDTVLTDLELETLTSYRSWESMVNELNLNIIYNG